MTFALIGVTFFLSIPFITVDTPEWIRWFYGLEVIVAVALWFTLLALFISYKPFKAFYKR